MGTLASSSVLHVASTSLVCVCARTPKVCRYPKSGSRASPTSGRHHRIPSVLTSGRRHASPARVKLIGLAPPSVATRVGFRLGQISRCHILLACAADAVANLAARPPLARSWAAPSVGGPLPTSRPCVWGGGGAGSWSRRKLGRAQEAVRGSLGTSGQHRMAEPGSGTALIGC